MKTTLLVFVFATLCFTLRSPDFGQNLQTMAQPEFVPMLLPHSPETPGQIILGLSFMSLWITAVICLPSAKTE